MLSLLEGNSYFSIKVLAYSAVSHGFIALFSILHCRDVIPLHSGQQNLLVFKTFNQTCYIMFGSIGCLKIRKTSNLRKEV
jgi:hypothetical protein